MKRIVLISILCLSSLFAKAQDYNWALGVRGGQLQSGVYLKHILSDSNAFEIGVNYLYPYTQRNENRQKAGEVLSAIYEWNTPIVNESLIFYFGFGGHAGAASVQKEGEDVLKSRLLAGVDGVAGLEYKLRYAPLAFSIDYRPMFELRTFNFRLSDFGLGIKLCF